MKHKNKWIVLIYVLFLVTLAVSFATILLNNSSYMFNINEYYDIEQKLYSNINSDWQVLVDINREFNSNWSWFNDSVSCPSWISISMSWTINRDDIWSTIINSWSVYCEASYLSKPVYIYFNSWMTDLVEASYSGYTVSITGWTWDMFFWDAESTLIDFSWYNVSTPDLYDDDYNSDNYMVTSTWNTHYLSWYQDDDVLGKTNIYWYVAPDIWYKKVFWNTDAFTKIVNDNTNNIDLLNMKIWDTSTWYLYFDIDKQFDMRLSVFDRTIYNDTKELILKERLDVSSSEGVLWFLEKDWTFSSTSSWVTSYNFNFDSTNDMYAIFLKSIWTWTLLYKIRWESDSWTWIYIAPIDDSNAEIVRYAGNEILITKKWEYITKESEIIYKK